MHLKRSCQICLSFLTLSAGVFAQGPESYNPHPYIFPEFVKSKVLQKGGALVDASLNYNTITQEMLFEKDGVRLVLDQAANMDTIYLQHRKFIIEKQGYLEKLTNTTIALYVQYKSKAVPSDKTGQSNKVLSEVYKKSDAQKVDPYLLRLPDHYSLKTDNKYWLKKGTEFIPATNEKKITGLFPGKEIQIAQFIKENNISLTDQNDIIKLLYFCNQ